MKIELEVYDCRELAIAYDALDKIQHHRDQRSGRAEVCSVTRTQHDIGPTVREAVAAAAKVIAAAPVAEVKTVAASFELPPVPIEQAIEEAHAESRVVLTGPADDLTTQVLVAAPTEEETIAIYREAISAGVLVPDVVEILTQFKVKRVPELAPEQRAAFIAALKGKIERAH